MKKSTQVGFSFIEIMIVLAIAAILGSIALSSYSDSVMKSKRTDAKDTLVTTSTKLEKCKTLYGAYNNANCSIQSGDTITSTGGLYSIAVNVPSATAYTLTATPVANQSQAQDSDCLSITLDNLGVQGGTTVNCW